MRFPSESYDKLFPRPEEKPSVESAVSTFTPSAEKDMIEDIAVIEEEVELEEDVEVETDNANS